MTNEQMRDELSTGYLIWSRSKSLDIVAPVEEIQRLCEVIVGLREKLAAQDAELERLRGFVNWIRARQDAHLSCSQCHLSALMVLVVLEEIDRLDAKAKEGGT
jgi:hypothetical protein